MTTMAMNVAIRSAIEVMLGRDEDVVVFGEDVGYFGGVFRCTEGLQAKYGMQRVFDVPIAEGGIIGIDGTVSPPARAAGAAGAAASP